MDKFIRHYKNISSPKQDILTWFAKTLNISVQTGKKSLAGKKSLKGGQHWTILNLKSFELYDLCSLLHFFFHFFTLTSLSYSKQRTLSKQIKLIVLLLMHKHLLIKRQQIELKAINSKIENSTNTSKTFLNCKWTIYYLFIFVSYFTQHSFQLLLPLILIIVWWQNIVYKPPNVSTLVDLTYYIAQMIPIAASTASMHYTLRVKWDFVNIITYRMIR